MLGSLWQPVLGDPTTVQRTRGIEQPSQSSPARAVHRSPCLSTKANDFKSSSTSALWCRYSAVSGNVPHSRFGAQSDFVETLLDLAHATTGSRIRPRRTSRASVDMDHSQ